MNVVYLPWYFNSNIKALGIDKGSLSEGLSIDDESNKGLALSDIIDVNIVNDFIYRYLFIGGGLSGDNNFINNTWRVTNKLDEKEINNIKMDMLNVLDGEVNDFKNTFTLMCENNTVFVVLNEGFTNFIKYNDMDKKLEFLSSITNFMFKHFNNSDVFKSNYYRSCLQLKNK